MSKDIIWIIEQYWIDDYNSPFDQELIFYSRKDAREALRDLKEQSWATDEKFRIAQFKRVGGEKDGTYTRVEIISSNGREYVVTDSSIIASVQDNGRTLKLFLSQPSTELTKSRAEIHGGDPSELADAGEFSTVDNPTKDCAVTDVKDAGSGPSHCDCHKCTGRIKK